MATQTEPLPAFARVASTFTVFKTSAALPVESYGLKSVGRYLDVARKLADYDGGLAIARYIQAVETNDPARRAEILSEILAYNEEDLDATWAVMEWLARMKSPA